jgi:hypothetical protein
VNHPSNLIPPGNAAIVHEPVRNEEVAGTPQRFTMGNASSKLSRYAPSNEAAAGLLSRR